VIEWTTILGISLALAQLAGVGFAIDAVLRGRTPQGTLAWALGLLVIPIITVPLYLVFGARRFEGYVKARRKGRARLSQSLRQLNASLEPFVTSLDPGRMGGKAITRMVTTPCTRGNRAELLVDGPEFFPALFSTVAAAKRTLLVQFYIMNDDDVGREFVTHLYAAADRGVRVLLLIDAIGCANLPRKVVSTLKAKGIEVETFRSARGPRTRLQINFRNHRKLVVADGRTMLVGGLNVGNEYNHKHPVLNPWRDTGLIIRGPAALEGQLSFLEDWAFVTGHTPTLEWVPVPAADMPPQADAMVARSSDDARVVVASTGPADELETGALMMLHLIGSARSRLWIASPYFVPDGSIIEALQLAAIRGVDVRLMIPAASDSKLVELASASFEDDMLPAGVRMFIYQPGFMHQKVLLSDNLAAIGSLNLDNRSLRINFELMALICDDAFVMHIEAMLQRDLSRCSEITLATRKRRPWHRRVLERVARLFAPIL